MIRLSRSRVLIIIVLLATAFAVFAYQRRDAAQAAVGRQAPGFALPDQSGATVDLASFRGRVVFLNFWTSWCTVCREESGAVETFYRRYGSRVTVLGIDWREPQAAIDTFRREFGITYPSLRDADGAVAQAYGLTGVPESWFLSPGGVARVHVLGAMTFEQMQQAFRRAAGRSIDGAGVGPVASGDHALSLAVAAGGRTLWIGTGRGLWTSTDGGATWSPIRGLPAGRPVASLALDSPVLYAAGPTLGLWRSADGGRTWSAVGAGLPGRDVSALATARGAVYAWVAHAGLYVRSGGAWRAVASASVLPAAPRALLVDVAGRPAAMLAATPRGVFRSPDGGRTWAASRITQPVPDTEELAAPITLPTRRVPLAAAGAASLPSGELWLAAPDGLWLSRDRGETASAAPGGPVRSFVALASDRGAVWALAPNGDVYRTVAAGGAWHRLRFGAVGAAGAASSGGVAS